MQIWDILNEKMFNHAKRGLKKTILYLKIKMAPKNNIKNSKINKKSEVICWFKGK